MENSDLELLKQCLSEAQSANNESRKAAENQLLTLKNQSPENYCMYLFGVLTDQSAE